MAIIGTTIRWPWTILDLNSDPLTGMTSPAAITFTLFRDSGTAIVAASEIVSFAESATAGTYQVSFTPQNSGLYTLQLKELNVNSLQRTYRQDFMAQSAGAVFAPSYANAFCSESDIERRLGLQISSTTSPNDMEAPGYAEARAAYLMAVCARLGFPVTPLTVTSGSRMEDLLREANAIGAAIDFLVAQGKYATPLEPGKVGSLQSLWEQAVGYYANNGNWIDGAVTMEISGNQVSLATSHVLSGDTTARAAENAPQDVGLQIRMGDLY